MGRRARLGTLLRTGGEPLVYDALNFATGRATSAGESLIDALGKPAAVSYLRAVLRIRSEGLLAGRSLSLVGDEVRAELIGYVRTARQKLLELIGAHAELVVAIGEGARDALEQAALPHPTRDRSEIARLPSPATGSAVPMSWSTTYARHARAEHPQPFLDLIREADDVADSLEESGYYWSLLPQGRASGKVLSDCQRMTGMVLDAARSHLRAHFSREIQRSGPSEDMDAFLEATHRIIALERDTDSALRDAQAAIVAEVDAAGVLFVTVRATQACEAAAGALMR